MFYRNSARSQLFETKSFNTKPQRPIALTLMVLIHIGLIFALTRGLTAPPSLPDFDPANVKVIDLPTRVISTSIDVIPIDVWQPSRPIVEQPTVMARTDDSVPSDNGVRRDEVGEVVTGAQIGSTTTPPRSDSRHPLTQPAYPPASRRMGEEGKVELMVYVTIDGRISEARIERSSGFARLDDAALREALRSWRLLPGRVNDVPIATWHRVAVTFNLK